MVHIVERINPCKGVISLIIYTVRPGDSVYNLSRQFGVSPERIIEENQLHNVNRLMIGQALLIPAQRVRHVVSLGQTLSSIARMYGSTVEDILKANPSISDPSQIHPGQVISVPVGTTQGGSIDVNGYALPDISMDVLDATLPNLTYLSIFSYQARPDGTITEINDRPLIERALRDRVAPLMVLTNIKEGGRFDSDIAHDILQSTAVQDLILDAVVLEMDEKNYYGLDVDFEYIYPEDRDAYVAFLRKAADKVRPLGYSISVALAPKLSATQKGILYEAHDYAQIGAIVDRVILMTYEWGYTYGPAQAVSPIDQVERVLQYAVSVMPSEKILMGMPNYGYDWTLPFVPGSAARSLSNQEAVELASRVGAMILYDERVQAPYFNYYDEQGRPHVVWFDDPRSIAARLALVTKYNLAGVSYWNINTFYPQNWAVLNAMYKVNKVL